MPTVHLLTSFEWVTSIETRVEATNHCGFRAFHADGGSPCRRFVVLTLFERVASFESELRQPSIVASELSMPTVRPLTLFEWVASVER